MPYCYFWKSGKIWNCRLLQIIGGAYYFSAYCKDWTGPCGSDLVHAQFVVIMQYYQVTQQGLKRIISVLPFLFAVFWKVYEVFIWRILYMAPVGKFLDMCQTGKHCNSIVTLPATYKVRQKWTNELGTCKGYRHFVTTWFTIIFTATLVRTYHTTAHLGVR